MPFLSALVVYDDALYKSLFALLCFTFVTTPFRQTSVQEIDFPVNVLKLPCSVVVKGSAEYYCAVFKNLQYMQICYIMRLYISSRSVLNYKRVVCISNYSRLSSTNVLPSWYQRVNCSVRCHHRLWVLSPRRPSTRGTYQCLTTDRVTVINSSWPSMTPAVLTVNMPDNVDWRLVTTLLLLRYGGMITIRYGRLTCAQKLMRWPT